MTKEHLQRRGELITKKFQEGITPDEEQELAGLENEALEFCESFEQRPGAASLARMEEILRDMTELRVRVEDFLKSTEARMKANENSSPEAGREDRSPGD
jgi:hypothetical protein